MWPKLHNIVFHSPGLNCNFLLFLYRSLLCWTGFQGTQSWLSIHLHLYYHWRVHCIPCRMEPDSREYHWHSQCGPRPEYLLGLHDELHTSQHIWIHCPNSHSIHVPICGFLLSGNINSAGCHVGCGFEGICHTQQCADLCQPFHCVLCDSAWVFQM